MELAKITRGLYAFIDFESGEKQLELEMADLKILMDKQALISNTIMYVAQTLINHNLPVESHPEIYIVNSQISNLMRDSRTTHAVYLGWFTFCDPTEVTVLVVPYEFRIHWSLAIIELDKQIVWLVNSIQGSHPEIKADNVHLGIEPPQAAQLDHASYICNHILKLNKDKIEYVSGAEMLTKIIYEAMGAQEFEIRAPSQNQWLAKVEDTSSESEGEKRAPPSHTTIGGRKLERVKRASGKQTEVLTSVDEPPPLPDHKRKREQEMVTVAQKRAKMERLMESFARERILKGDYDTKWKPSAKSFRRLRTKNPTIGTFEEEAWDAYIAEHVDLDEPAIKLSEAELSEMKEAFRPNFKKVTPPRPSSSSSEDSKKTKWDRVGSEKTIHLEHSKHDSEQSRRAEKT
ncbi:hypothetical protein L7F22_004743 [Adiantum nelumboides]|nr:hypothetical protein [Adiantum nelumboides]